MKPLSKNALKQGESIFTVMSLMAKDHGAINLSQGLPDFDGPEFVKEFATQAITEGKNQSASPYGLLSLRKAIADSYKEFYDLNYDAEKEITITCGATEAIFSTLMAIINPGDEVIVFEPFFDTYIPSIEMAGGIAKTVTLKAPDFCWDIEQLKLAFSSKTKAVIFNTPHNPSGKVFSKEEMTELSELIIKNDCYLISDEVYQFLTFDNCSHLPPAALSEMKERTITISSTGKTFGLTGWRLGWAACSSKLTHAIRMVHQNNVFSAARPLQEAMAKSFNKLPEYIPGFQKLYQTKRDLLLKGLTEAGFNPITPQSTYFILCPLPTDYSENAEQYAKRLITENKIATIPCSAFYNRSDEGDKYIRFCFAKKDETIKQAIEILTRRNRGH